VQRRPNSLCCRRLRRAPPPRPFQGVALPRAAPSGEDLAHFRPEPATRTSTILRRSGFGEAQPSQTWRTFLANHIGQLTLISPATSPCAPHEDDVIDVSRLPFCQPPSWNDELFASRRGVVVDWCASLQRASCAMHNVQHIREAHGHLEPHGPRTADSLDRLRRPTVLPSASLPLHGPLRRTIVSDDRPQADSRGLRQRRLKRLGSN
jgi:hypothetical protein